MGSVTLEQKVVGINDFVITDFSDGKPLKAERIGACTAVAFYNPCSGSTPTGALAHPIRGTLPELFSAMVRERLSSSGMAVAIIGSVNAHPATDYFITGLIEFLERAGYDLRFKGFREPALRDAVLWPNGLLEVYRYDTKATEKLYLR
jgi:hypothetical protein